MRISLPAPGAKAGAASDILRQAGLDFPGQISETERFVEEVEQVRQAIGADSSNFYVLGNSWGGILAMEYALKYQSHMKGLLVANMMASAPEYGKYAEEVLAKQMKPEVLAEIRAIEAKKEEEKNRRKQTKKNGK